MTETEEYEEAKANPQEDESEAQAHCERSEEHKERGTTPSNIKAFFDKARYKRKTVDLTIDGGGDETKQKRHTTRENIANLFGRCRKRDGEHSELLEGIQLENDDGTMPRQVFAEQLEDSEEDEEESRSIKKKQSSATLRGSQVEEIASGGSPPDLCSCAAQVRGTPVAGERVTHSCDEFQRDHSHARSQPMEEKRNPDEVKNLCEEA